MINVFRLLLRKELEAPAEHRRFGTGWLSGVLALAFGLAALTGGICARYPGLFTVEQLRDLYLHVPYRLIIQGALLISFFSHYSALRCVVPRYWVRQPLS